MSKIIGGILPSPHISFKEQEENVLYLANARCGLFVIADTTKPQRVWMPNYYCPSMLQSFQCNVEFYNIDNNLQPDLKTIKAESGDLVVAIDYFGFPTSESALKHARSCGALAVEDASQSLIKTPFSDYADFVVYSPRKFLPVPDGGIVIKTCNQKMNCSLETPPYQWLFDSLSAMDYRRHNESDNETWFKKSQKAKENAPVGYYAMSLHTRMLLNSFDLWEIACRQRRNYNILLSKLSDMALFKTIGEATVPIGFPIVCENRDELRQKLFANKVFPPIHWENSHDLSKRIMTLPCSFFYDPEDMEFVADIVTHTCHLA